MSRIRLQRVVGTTVLLVIVCGVVASVQKTDSQIVTVTGRGATMYEARVDAIRQALQQTVKQLVLAHRVVQNDRVALDQIASTMNGYVSRFTPKSTTTVNGVVNVEADVEVSESRVENFLATTTGGQTQINTSNVLASVQREVLARRARSEVLVGLFASFPQGALEASPPTVTIDQRDPNRLNVTHRAWISPLYIRHLKEGLRSLGARRELQGSFQPPNTVLVCFGGMSVRREVGGSRSLRNEMGMASRKYECWAVTGIDLSVFMTTEAVGHTHQDHATGCLNGVIAGLLVIKRNGEYERLPTTESRRPQVSLTERIVFQKDRTGDGTSSGVVQSLTYLLIEGDHLITQQFAADNLQHASDLENIELTAIPVVFSRECFDLVDGVVWSLVPTRILPVPLPADAFQELTRSFVPSPTTPKRR